MTDALGWWATFLSLLGSILLMLPMFDLLRTREALEDLEDRPGLDDKTREANAVSRNNLKKRAVRGRQRLRLFGGWGAAFLILALALTGIQGLFLPERLLYFF
ncbi:hypothetical protein [Azospirillum sp. B4]|uniref:hypothetical protein n=1 Tax=Azospirillum sp. B4 TaxID=95605 RepID=UPI0005CB4ACD|nr:hypothetical protein [Azospirillum sp. B4]